ncbi:MAG: FG-GAP-like repeat-containing protein, partial [Nevskiales bacterium]
MAFTNNPVSWVLPTGSATYAREIVADFNGDGMSDVMVWNNPNASQYNLWPSNGDGTFGTPIPTGVGIYSNDSLNNYELGDFNGDGQIDIMTWYKPGNTTQFYLHLSNGNGFGPAIPTGIPTFDNTYLRNVAADFNGDGRTDFLVWHAPYNNNRYNLYLSNGTNFTLMPQTATSSLAVFVNPDVQNYEVGDFNGDGMMDMLLWSAAAVYNLHLANGTGFDPAIQTNVKTFTNPGLGNIAADFNGDGKTDMLVWHAPLNNNRYNLYLANGVGFEAAVNTGIQGFSNTGIANPISGDFNGDGLTDVLSYHVPFSNYRYNLNLNNGRGFNAAAATNLRATESIVRSQTGDVNGDGRTDVLIYATPNAGRYNLHLSLSQPPELMTRITNGLGAEINVSHKSLTDTSVYTKGTGASYPVQDVISSMSVVSQTTATNGLGGLNAVDYKYESLKVQVRGRGMQGFGRVVSTDNTAGITETTNYRLDFPFTGMALDSESMDSSGRILSKTVNTPGSTTANCGGYGTQFPFVASSRQESYEIQAYSSYVAKTQTTDYQYDGCGNALSVTVANYKGTVSTQDRHVSTSVNTYSGNPANWILGRLSRTEVTSTLPSGASATRVSSFTYDAATGFLTSETVEPNGGSMTTIYGYDPFGNKTSVTVSDNVSISRTTRTSYEANGRFPVAVTNAKNHTELHTYDPSHGGRMSLTGPNGLTTTWQYDLFGRMTLETRPDLTTTTTSYLWCGSLCVNGGVMAIRSTGSDGSDGLVTLDVLEREIGTRKLGFDGTWIQG